MCIQLPLLYLKMVRMIMFMLCIFYLSKNIIMNEASKVKNEGEKTEEISEMGRRILIKLRAKINQMKRKGFNGKDQQNPMLFL